uniref:Uncharacterized protein n=1 Tax=Nelumbo nucifera TaxID=4432 RepID=A0A822YZ83_NELNU|nr:TPA_asm: hypothetical protein HUJ06_006696 [Nelumbo nucifera]
MTCLRNGLHVEGRGQTTVQRLATEVRRKLVRTQKTGLVAGPGRVCNNRSCDYLSSHVSRGEGSVCSSIVDKLNRLSSSTSVQGFSLKLAFQPNVVPDDDEVCNGEIVKGRKKHKRRKIRDFGRKALDIHRPKFKRRGPMVRSAPNESRKRKGETWIWVIAKYDKSGKKSLIGETGMNQVSSLTILVKKKFDNCTLGSRGAEVFGDSVESEVSGGRGGGGDWGRCLYW